MATRRIVRPNRAAIYSTVGYCQAPDCGLPMLSRWAWDAGVRRIDHVAAGAKGLCRKHYLRLSRHGSLDSQAKPPPRERRGPGNGRSRDEVLDEWAFLREGSDISVAEGAERMGMTFSALDMALYRARRRGDPRGNITYKRNRQEAS